jgi:hypothetical protein
MIEIAVSKNGTATIRPAQSSPEASRWLEALFEDDFFSSPSSDKTLFHPPSDDETINEEWNDFSIPDMLASCSSLRKKFRTPDNCLVFDANSSSELAALLNQARMKIAVEGTADVLPPSPSNPRLFQYEFLTALLETVMQLGSMLPKPRPQVS